VADNIESMTVQSHNYDDDKSKPARSDSWPNNKGRTPFALIYVTEFFKMNCAPCT